MLLDTVSLKAGGIREEGSVGFNMEGEDTKENKKGD